MQIRPIPFPLPADKPAVNALSRLIAVARGSVEAVWRPLWRALISRARRCTKLLVLVESSSLGDRRFISVVQFEQQRFLIGSSPSSVTLLARLPDAETTPAEMGASANAEESQ